MFYVLICFRVAGWLAYLWFFTLSRQDLSCSKNKRSGTWLRIWSSEQRICCWKRAKRCVVVFLRDRPGIGPETIH